MSEIKKVAEAFALGFITTGVELFVGRTVLNTGVNFLSKCYHDLADDDKDDKTE